MIALFTWNLIQCSIFQVSHEFSNLARDRSSPLFINAGFIEAEISPTGPFIGCPMITLVQALDLKHPGHLLMLWVAANPLSSWAFRRWPPGIWLLEALIRLMHVR
jgi:hypothetical protein